MSAINLRESDRIFGTEGEIALLAPDRGYVGSGGSVHVKYWPPLESYPSRVRSMFSGEVPQLNGFIRGGRVYPEPAGGFAEFSTRESTSPLSVIRSEHYGEEYVNGLVKFLSSSPRFPSGARTAVKRTIGEHGNTAGMHLNLLGLREFDILHDYGPVLGSLIATSLWAGAGGTKLVDGEHQFMAAAKLSDVTTMFNYCTIADKPLINLRDEPHADINKYRRIHITSYDGNMWPLPHFVKMVSASLVARLKENGIPCDDLILADPVAAARECCIMGVNTPDDINDRIAGLKVELKNGEWINPLDLQDRFIKRVRLMAESHYISAEEQLGLDLWESLNGRMMDDASSCEQHVEWIGKLTLGIQSLKRPRTGHLANQYTWDNFDVAWCIQDRDKSLGVRTRQKFEPQREILGMIAVASSLPTRADAREAVIDSLDQYGDFDPIIAFNWSKIGTPYEDYSVMSDPFDSDPERWLAYVERAYAKEIDYRELYEGALGIARSWYRDEDSRLHAEIAY